MLRVSDPGDGLSDFKSHGFGIELQAHPLPDLRQGPRVLATGLALGAPFGGACVAPDDTVFPVALKELKHDHLRRGGRIQTNPGKHLSRSRNFEGQALVDCLNQPISALLQGGLPELHGTLRRFHPGGSTLDTGSSRSPIFQPNRLDLSGRWLRVQGGWIGVGQALNTGLHRLLRLLNTRLHFGEFLKIFFRLYRSHRRSAQRVSIHRGIGCAVEERIKRIELLLGDGVEFVVVTDGAPGRQPHPGLRGGGGPLDRVAEHELGIDGAAFARSDIVAIEACGHQLVLGWIGEKISRQLLHGELIEGQIAVEGPDHPIAIGPDLTFIIQVEPVGIGVARDVEPMAPHLFAILRAVHQAIHPPLIAPGTGVCQERVHFGRCGREPPEVHAQAAQ